MKCVFIESPRKSWKLLLVNTTCDVGLMEKLCLGKPSCKRLNPQVINVLRTSQEDSYDEIQTAEETSGYPQFKIHPIVQAA